MKVPFLATAVLLVGMSSDARAQRIVAVSEAFGKTYEVHLPDGLLERTPDWDSDAENPPLSPRKALTLADEAASQLVSTPDQYKRVMVGAELTRGKFPGPNDKWYWLIHYNWILKQGSGSGIPDHLSVVVLMDGTVVEPKVTTHDRR